MTLWGGRFDGSMSAGTWAFTVDHSDRRLLEVDVLGSIAHARMLGTTGIIPGEESDLIIEGLEGILEEARSGRFAFSDTDEDVHSAVERRLGEVIGEVAGKLHTGRSRNDQVATDLRVYISRLGDEVSPLLHELAEVLVDIAEEHISTLIPTYTHLQQAQSTTLGNHMLAHTRAFVRDIYRLSRAVMEASQSPLGSGASAGSSLPLDRDSTAEELGLLAPMPNTLDAVSSRDFVAEYVFVCAQAMVHLSRLAEEIILWSTREFGWVTLSDEVSTGSSALPHKRNPDIAELIRGRTATVIGDITAILALQKALPLTYNRDLQEDKRILFHASDTLVGCLGGMITLLRGLTFHPPAPSVEVATLDLADVLVTRGVPFREAHGIVGRVVRGLEEQGRSLEDLNDEDLIATDARFQPGDASLLDPGASASRRRTEESVREEIDNLRYLFE